jgi:3-mercaptopyruvate sulfurtransferase SseA
MFGTRVNGRKARELVAAGAVLIDTRDAVSFRDGTIPGAINISLRQISSLNSYAKNTKFVMFGMNNDDENLSRTTGYVAQLGFQNIYVLGCMDNWNKF